MLLLDGWALVPLRLVIGFGFAMHGYAKLARGPGQFAAVLDAMGIPGPTVMAWLTTLLELAGGIALIAGAAVGLLALPLAVVMVTAMIGVHLPYGFSSIKLQSIGAAGAQFGPPGYELNLIYIASLIALALGEPTQLSIDRWLARSRARERR